MNAKKLSVFIIILLSIGAFNMPPIQGGATATETIQIVNPDDDFFSLDGGAQTGTNIIVFKHPTYDTYTFLRFRNVEVEQNAVITSVILSVYRGTAETTGTSIWSTIYGIAEDDCPLFEQPDHVGPIQTSYPKTPNYVNWDTSTFGVGWHNITITGIGAAIIGRFGWESGNDLGLQILGAEGGGVTRAFWSYEANPILSAKLYITYTTGAPDVDEPGFPTGYDPDDLTFNDTIIYNNQTFWIWQLQELADNGIVQFYGKAASAFSYVSNATGTPVQVAEYEVTGDAVSYYNGKYYVLMYVITSSDLYFFESSDLISFTLKTTWTSSGTVITASFTIDENGIVYFFWGTRVTGPTFRYRDFDLVGNVWKAAASVVATSGAGMSVSYVAQVFTFPDGSKQYYTCNLDGNALCYTRDGWVDTTFTLITVADYSSGYVVYELDSAHYYNSTSGDHYAYFLIGMAGPVNTVRGVFMDPDDTIHDDGDIFVNWAITVAPQFVAVEFNRGNPNGIMVAFSKDAYIHVEWNPSHGLSVNDNWDTTTEEVFNSEWSVVSGQADMGYLSGKFALIYSKVTTHYPVIRYFNITAGTWGSAAVLWSFATKVTPTEQNQRGMFFYRDLRILSTSWIVVDENGTIIWTGPDYPDNITDSLPPDPWDPGDDIGPFSRFKMRLYFLVIGLFLFTGPIIFLATRPEGAIWYLVAPVVMLIGVAIMASITLI